MRNRLRRFFQSPAGMYLSIGMLLGATAAVAVISYRAMPARADVVNTANLSRVEQTTLAALESALMKIVEGAAPAVVRIRANKELPEASFFRFGDSPTIQGQGSGVVIRSDGWILTNDHVVRGADKVIVEFADGRELEGTVRRDYLSDVAVVKVNASGLPTLPFADSDAVRPGQFAIAIGSPFGLENSVTIGFVSAVSRAQSVPDYMPRFITPRDDPSRPTPTGRYYPSLIQTDAAINPGNSGGPLINIHGEVIGINTAIASTAGGNVGVGFAIPINVARDIANQLIEKGKVARGYLGVRPEDLSAQEKEKLGITSGAIVREVPQEGPAGKAGIRVGDVVVEIDGTAIRRELDLRMKMLHTPPGEQVRVKVLRDGKTREFDVKVGVPPMDPDIDPRLDEPKREQRESVPKLEIVPTKGRLGVAVSEIDDRVRTEYKLPQGVAGVVVVEVEPGTPADRVGLRPGDVIERFNGRSVRTPDELRSLVERARGSYSLEVRRPIGGQLARIQIQIRE